MNQPPPQTKKRELTISRRSFIVGSIVGGTAISMGIVSSEPAQAFLFEKLSHAPISKRIVDEATSNRRSPIWTVLETAATWIFNVVIGYAIDWLGVDHGGHAADGELYAEQLEAAPIQLYLRDNFAIPTMEEAIFRLLPSAFFSEETPPNVKLHWGTGLTSAAIFAGIHNFSKPEVDKITLHFDSIPVEQFILGMYCWYAQRRGGFGHAVGAHVLYNNLCEAYWHLYESKQLAQKDETESSPASNAATPKTSRDSGKPRQTQQSSASKQGERKRKKKKKK